MSGYIVSADIGGTFVDAVVWELGKGRFSIGKAPTTPADPPVGIFGGFAAAAERAKLTADHVLRRTALFINSTTATTSAVIERKGVPTGLPTTAGFEDTIASGNMIARTDHYPVRAHMAHISLSLAGCVNETIKGSRSGAAFSCRPFRSERLSRGLMGRREASSDNAKVESLMKALKYERFTSGYKTFTDVIRALP